VSPHDPAFNADLGSDVIRKRTLTFPYGSEKVRGVNLGGWFVLERASISLPSINLLTNSPQHG
jgi:hypothetical protein